MSVEEITTYWKNYNVTDTNPIISEVSNTNTSDGSTVDRKIWSNGTGGVKIQELKIIGGEHDWPGSSGNMDINANDEIWEFLSKFNKNGMIGNLNLFDEKKSISISPNPFDSYVRIEGIDNELLHIYDLHGRKYSLKINQNILDTKSLQSGIYFLAIKEEKLIFKLIKY